MRIGFVIIDFEWLGGVNYLRSLFQAIGLQKTSALQLVLVVAPKNEEKARKLFGDFEVLSTPLLTRWSGPHLVRKCIEKLTGRDYLLDRFLQRHGVDLCSHGPVLGVGAKVPCLAWIPDFQHVHLPHFFSSKEIRKRDRLFLRMGRYAAGVIVSSESARRDFEAFMPEAISKVHVMHFVPSLPEVELVELAVLEKRYGFDGRYFFLPNQFWAHKNHLVVINALALLKKQGMCIQVLCTGATADGRNPHHFETIKAAIKDGDLHEQFRILGVVPYLDMLSLMLHSHAVINPSLFEGWSTTVEEAKLLDKKLILSAIPVHREQSIGGEAFFDPISPDECAFALTSIWNETEGRVSNVENGTRALESLRVFGGNYFNIVDRLRN